MRSRPYALILWCAKGACKLNNVLVCVQEFFTGGSEQNTVVNSQMYIGNVLWLLAKHAPADLWLQLDYDRDAATTHSVSSISLLDGCQPNFHAAVLFRLMILGKDQVRPLLQNYHALMHLKLRQSELAVPGCEIPAQFVCWPHPIMVVGRCCQMEHGATVTNAARVLQ